MSKSQPGDPKVDKKATEVEAAVRKFFSRRIINNLDTSALKKLQKTFHRLANEFDAELYEKMQQSIGYLKGQINILKRKTK